MFKQDRYTQIVTVWFLFLTGWWIWLHTGDTEGKNYLLFGALYGTTIALFASIVGLRTAQYWGGWKSVMGKALIFLSAGIFAQFFGQAAFSFYNIVLKVYVPYPSIADLGYFGNIPFYVLAMLFLARASGGYVGLKSFGSQLRAILIPLAMVIFSYVLFLRSYDFADTPLLTIFLDFGYPIGQGLYVSFAILTFALSVKILGGVMRGPIFLLLAALVFQYIADFNFLYQNIHGTWQNGGYGDYLYLLAYFVMALGLFQIRLVTKKRLHVDE